MATTSVIEIVVFGVLAALGASCFAVSALGVALIFQIGYFLAGSLELLSDSESLTEANIYLTSLLLPMSVFQSIHLRAHWNISYVIYFGVIRAACTAAGISILISNDTIWLVRALGIFLLISFFIFAYIQYYQIKSKQIRKFSSYFDENSKDIPMNNQNKNEQSNTSETELTHLVQTKDDGGVSFEVNSCQKRLVLMALGVSSGLIRGLWGIAGVPIMFFAIITNINFNEFRSSTAFAIILSEIVSIIQLYVIEDKMDINNKWIEYIAILCGGAVGILIGNYLAKYHMNQFYFHLFIMYIMFTGGIVLLVKDIWTPLFDIIVTSILLAAPCLFIPLHCLRRILCKKGVETYPTTSNYV